MFCDSRVIKACKYRDYVSDICLWQVFWLFIVSDHSGGLGATLGICHVFLLSTELYSSMGIVNSLNKVSIYTYNSNRYNREEGAAFGDLMGFGECQGPFRLCLMNSWMTSAKPVQCSTTRWPDPNWLVSSAGRALHRYWKGHGFDSRTCLGFFQDLFPLNCSSVRVYITAMTTYVGSSMYESNLPLRPPLSIDHFSKIPKVF